MERYPESQAGMIGKVIFPQKSSLPRPREVVVLSNTQNSTESRKMKKWGNIFQTKEKHKSSETNPAEMDISYSLNTEFKIMV